MLGRIRKKRLLLCVCLTWFIFWLYYLKYDHNFEKFSKYIPNINYSEIVDTATIQYRGNFLQEEERKTKTILLFTTHFHSDIWKGLHPNLLDGYTRKAKCMIKECEITYDKTKISTADVVVFHGVDFGFRNFTSEHFHALRKSSPPYQRWLFWMHKSPAFYSEAAEYDNLFNWTMTFSRQSDIYHPYYSYASIPQDEMPQKHNYALGKTKKIAWVVNHCGMMREEYVMELQRYADVTVYGLCGASFNNMGGICSKVEPECVEELSQYKFYLSFEKTFCEDYVTEKYYKFGLLYGLVPIVMGTRYDSLNSVPGSYIDTSDFSSIEELGHYINYLDSHDDAYNKYFEWKNHFKVTDGIDKICLICHAVHNTDKGTHNYPNFNLFWSTKNMCSSYEKVREELNRQIAVSRAKIDTVDGD